MSPRLRAGCAALVAYPLVEVTIAVAVASLVGWWWVVVGVIACIVVGLGLVRYALGATGASMSTALSPLRASDQPAIGTRSPSRPSASPAQTLLIVPAGLLIAVPGLATTLLGLILWVPTVRRRIASRWELAMRRAVPEPPAGYGE